MKERQNKTFLTTKHTFVQLKVQIIINIQEVFVIFVSENIFFCLSFLQQSLCFCWFFEGCKNQHCSCWEGGISSSIKSLLHINFFSCWKKSLFIGFILVPIRKLDFSENDLVFVINNLCINVNLILVLVSMNYK